MSMIRIAKAVTSLEINGTDYEFLNVTNITYNNPVTTNILSSPQGKTDGLDYKTNLTQASTANVTLREVPAEIQQLIKKSFDNNERVKLTCIDAQNGKTLECKKAVIATDPDNTTVGETETDFDITLSLQFAWNNGSYKYKQV